MWVEPAVNRDQLVLFPKRLDEAIGPNHPVRAIDLLLERIDWSPWEAGYHGHLGQPAIHPRVLCSVLLYGLICRIRASRKLEEALEVRLDFRWLAHGLSIDHTTLSEFRRKHPEQLRDLFVQVVLIGRELGLAACERIAFDGTRVRANNRKTGTRTPKQLEQLKQDLQDEFDRLNKKADAEDQQDDEVFAHTEDQSTTGSNREETLSQIQAAQAKLDLALAELDKIKQSSEKTPTRLPITDPESRFGKTKEGSFAPNYTPTATVDVDSGLILDQTVIPQSNESGELIPTIEQVVEDCQLTQLPEVLADGLMATGENLQACQDREVSLYSPVPGTHSGENPAIRDDLTQPVSPEKIDQLPMRTVTVEGRKEKRFAKQAFVYDAESNVYWCPQGERLTHSSSYTTTEGGREVQRERYRADPAACAACPLFSRCVSGRAGYRQVDRGPHETILEEQKAKMTQPESQRIYAQRRAVGERPFAAIKHGFGLRQFLTRGLRSVQQEWTWAALAFNVKLLAQHFEAARPP